MNKIFLITFLLILFNSLLISALEEPIINISLSKQQYLQKDKIVGDIILTFINQTEDKDLEVRFGPNSDITQLSQLLDMLGKTYEITQGEKELVPLRQPDDSIIFPPLVQELGVSVSKNAEEFTAVGSIGGWDVEGSVPKFPYLDVGSDGLIEWSYLGGLIGWTNYINENDLGNEAGAVDIQNPDASVCQKINLNSKVKAINVTAKYKAVASGVTVKAKLLSVPDNSKKSFGTSNCDLIKGNDQWGSCIINFNEIPKVRQGEYLICITPDLGTTTATTTIPSTTLFTILKDSRSTQKAYICTHKPEGYYECNSNNNYNYFIKTSLPIYNGTLDKSSTSFSEGITEANLNNGFMSYLSSDACQDQEENCIIPIEAGSLTPGRLYFNDFTIKVKYQGISEDTKIQKLRSLSDVITKIDSKSLSSNTVKVSIPIRVLYNFSTPTVVASEVIPLEVRYGSSRAISFIEVNPSVLSGQQEVNATITNILILLDSYSNTETKDLLNKVNINTDSLKSQFLTYKIKLGSIESNTSKTQNEKDNEKLALLQEVENLKKSVPSYFYSGDKVFNIPAIPPAPIDIKASILGDKNFDSVKEYVLSLQDSISISSNAKAFSVKTFGNQSMDYTIITRVVAGAPSDAFIVDIIPKSIAQSSSNLILDPSITVLESDPLIKKQLSLGSGTLSYMVQGNVVDQITGINTLVISLINAPSSGSTRSASYTNVRCGNGICDVPLEDEKVCPEDCTSKRNWTLVTILLVILVVGIFYINFYKGPGSIQHLFKVKERLFHSESDKTNLISYTKRSLKYKSKGQITNTLLSKGWNQKQIDFVFKEIQKNKK